MSLIDAKMRAEAIADAVMQGLLSRQVTRDEVVQAVLAQGEKSKPDGKMIYFGTPRSGSPGFAERLFSQGDRHGMDIPHDQDIGRVARDWSLKNCAAHGGE